MPGIIEIADSGAGTGGVHGAGINVRANRNGIYINGERAGKAHHVFSLSINSTGIFLNGKQLNLRT